MGFQPLNELTILQIPQVHTTREIVLLFEFECISIAIIRQAYLSSLPLTIHLPPVIEKFATMQNLSFLNLLA